jgi:hypothetical protein
MLVGIVACVYGSIMMPWAEMDMDTRTIPHTFRLLHLEPAADALDKFYGQTAEAHRASLDAKTAEGNRGEYVYSFAIGLAILGGALAVAAIGSADEQEKMLMPEKKK